MVAEKALSEAKGLPRARQSEPYRFKARLSRCGCVAPPFASLKAFLATINPPD
jgi:hypothetical protein